MQGIRAERERLLAHHFYHKIGNGLAGRHQNLMGSTGWNVYDVAGF
jgi:hypothetical protein